MIDALMVHKLHNREQRLHLAALVRNLKTKLRCPILTVWNLNYSTTLFMKTVTYNLIAIKTIPKQIYEEKAQIFGKNQIVQISYHKNQDFFDHVWSRLVLRNYFNLRTFRLDKKKKDIRWESEFLPGIKVKALKQIQTKI